MQKCRDLIVNLSSRGFSLTQGPLNQVSPYVMMITSGKELLTTERSECVLEVGGTYI